MNKSVIGWSLTVILGISFIVLSVYTSNLKEELIGLEDKSYSTFYFDMTREIKIMENILVFEKEIIEGNGDLESFKQLFDLSSYSVLERPSFPLKMSETEVIEFNKKRLMIMENILNFQNAKSKDDRKTAIVEFEQGLKDYKKTYDAWLELENKCSDMGGFCTRRD
ncbi:hypothetical protein ACFPYN_09555 [Paenisporosarcina macmurdoensis]|uniref:Chemotaxis methyl-accepting receptor HlyB-like 4HB MCP domain-containing protein n=1 Tax=Paenisporosarcina macmurdoensis TaxID=212659 RepID=A0ABW1L995_9BACL